MAIIRNVDGFNDVSTNHILDQFAHLNPLRYHIFFDDFDTYIAGNDAAAVWTKTETGSGTQAIADADGGVLLLTTAAADNDRIQLQLKAETFKFEDNKKAWFAAKFYNTDADQSIMFVGLATEQTTTNFLSTDTWAYDDGVGFRKDDGDAYLDFVIRKDDAETNNAAIATLTDSVAVVVGFYYNGVDTVKWFTTATTGGGQEYQASGLTNWPDDAELAPTLFIETGEANAAALGVDYIFVAKER